MRSKVLAEQWLPWSIFCERNPRERIPTSGWLCAVDTRAERACGYSRARCTRWKQCTSNRWWKLLRTLSSCVDLEPGTWRCTFDGYPFADSICGTPARIASKHEWRPKPLCGVPAVSEQNHVESSLEPHQPRSTTRLAEAVPVCLLCVHAQRNG